MAKLVGTFRIRCFQIGLLAPDPIRASKHIDRAAAAGTIVRLIAIDPSCVAVLIECPDSYCIAALSDTGTEVVTSLRIRRFQIGLLSPCRAAAGKDIDCPAA